MVNNGDLETNPQARALEAVLGMAIGDDRVDAPTILNALNAAGIDWTVFWQTSYLPQKISTLLTGLPIPIPLLTAAGHPEWQLLTSEGRRGPPRRQSCADAEQARRISLRVKSRREMPGAVATARFVMTVVTETQAASRLGSLMDRVVEDHAPLVITREGAEAVVLIALADWSAAEATAHLLSTARNARRLRSAVRDLEAE